MGYNLVKAVLDSRSGIFEAGAAVARRCEFTEIEALAAHLKNLGEMSVDEVWKKLEHVEVPRDFYHVRFYNLSLSPDDRSYLMPWGDVTCTKLIQLTLRDIVPAVAAMTVVNRNTCTPSGRGIWTDTVALPVQYAGTLELGLIFSSVGPLEGWDGL